MGIIQPNMPAAVLPVQASPFPNWITKYVNDRISDTRGINIKDYGALTGIANAAATRAAIQNAVNDAHVIGGKVIVPAGDFYIDQMINGTDKNVFIEGQNATGSFNRGSSITTTSLTDHIILVSTAAQSISGVTIRDIRLTGNKAAGSFGSGIEIQSSVAGLSIFNILIDNVYVTNCKEHGIHLSSNSASSFIFFGALNNNHAINNGKDNIRLEGNVSEITMTSNYTDGAGTSNVAFIGDKSKPTTVADIECNHLITGAGPYGVNIQYASNISINDLYTESQTTAQVYIKNGKGIRINGGSVRQIGTADGIVIDASDAGSPSTGIWIDIPGWILTSTKTRINLLNAGTNIGNLYLGSHADGAFSPADITGYNTAFISPADTIFFTAGLKNAKSMAIKYFGEGTSGTWTSSYAGGFNDKTITRTPAVNTVQNYNFYVPLAQLAAAGSKKGIKPTAVVLVYEITGADPGDDLLIVINRGYPPADGSNAWTMANIAGTYDAAHDTAAKRVNAGGAGKQYNTLTFTLTNPVWLDFAGDQEFFVSLIVSEVNDVTGALGVVVRGIFLRYTGADL